MKKTNFTLKRSSISVVLATILLFSVSSCQKKVDFLTSQVVPAATGNVKIYKDKNKNYIVKLHLNNLAEVTSLSPEKQTYVVWVDTDQETARNLGQLKSSKKLQTSFKAVSTYKPTKVYITAENIAGVKYPDKTIIISTENF